MHFHQCHWTVFMSVMILWYIFRVSSEVTTYTNHTHKRQQKAKLVRKFLHVKLSEGQLRLVDGGSEIQGNVEVFHEGKWGYICDDEWDQREADVVCRQMGFPAAKKPTYDAHFGSAQRRYWMDNIYCEGTEEHLVDCKFDGWGIHDCTNAESAGVVCYKKGKVKEEEHGSGELETMEAAEQQVKVEEPRIALQIGLGRRTLHIRLRGGRVPTEGRVEVSVAGDPWGLVCGDSWTLFEASVVCKSLGFGFANDAIQINYFGGNSSSIRLSSVQCKGNEKSLTLCQVGAVGELARYRCPGSGDMIAGVVCTNLMADLVPDPYELQRSVYLEDKQLFFLQCALEENCLATRSFHLQETGANWHLEIRRLLRFTASISNIGTADFVPSVPKHLWEWHSCHRHYHSMEVFAHFDILDSRGHRMAEGHKASFCLEDNECVGGAQPRYACANYGDQGITPGCSDIYRHNIDCQWVDVTELKPGIYTFKVVINPEFKVAEMTFDNNAAVCTLYYTESYAHVTNCSLQRP